MEDKLKLIVDSFGPNRVKRDVPLKDQTALNVGGNAALFFIAFTTQDIITMEEMARDLKLPLFIFGTGSKIFMESGFNGVVIKNRTSNIHVIGVKGKVSRNGMGVDEALVEADSGVSLKKLSDFLRSQNLQDEGLSAFSGTIGGNLFLNRILRDRAKKIKVVENGQIEEVSIEDIKVGKQIILSAVFNFKAGM